MRSQLLITTLLLLSFLAAGNANPASATPQPNATWARTYAGTPGFAVSSVQQTRDGGFVIAGEVINSGGIGQQTWLARLSPTGQVLWQKTYGVLPLGYNPWPQVVESPDGSLYVSSITNVSSRIGAWIFKTDSSGELIWQEAFTKPGTPLVSSIDITADGGIIGVGFSNSSPGFSTGFAIRLDSNGIVEWEKTFSGEGQMTTAFSVRHTMDGGFIVAGWTFPNCCDFYGYLLRLDSNGNLIWEKTYDKISIIHSVVQTPDGGFAATGLGIQTRGMIVLQTDANGIPLWTKNFSGNVNIDPISIDVTSDGGLVIAGDSGTTTTPFIPNPLIVRLDSIGNIEWQKNFLAAPYSEFLQTRQTFNGGFVAVGYTFTPSPSALILKLGPDGEIHDCDQMSDSNLSASMSSTTASTISDATVDISIPPVITNVTSTSAVTTDSLLCHQGPKN